MIILMNSELMMNHYSNGEHTVLDKHTTMYHKCTLQFISKLLQYDQFTKKKHFLSAQQTSKLRQGMATPPGHAWPKPLEASPKGCLEKHIILLDQHENMIITHACSSVLGFSRDMCKVQEGTGWGARHTALKAQGAPWTVSPWHIPLQKLSLQAWPLCQTRASTPGP